MAEIAAHAAAIARAIKASGVLVRMEPPDFLRIVNKQDDPLIIRAPGGYFRRHWRYLTPYRGLAFFAKSTDPLPLPGRAQVLDAQEIWIPD